MGDATQGTSAAPEAGISASLEPAKPATTVLVPPVIKKKCAWIKPVLIGSLIVGVFILIASSMKKKAHIRDQLAASGWVLYTQDGCPGCIEQKLILDGHAAHQINCSTGKNLVPANASSLKVAYPAPDCSAVTQVPFWFNTVTGKTVTGVQSTAALKKMI